MDLAISGQEVVVTGASKGIGLAIAREFAAEGATVTLVERNADALEKTAAEMAGHGLPAPRTFVADLSTDGRREALADTCGTAGIMVSPDAFPFGRPKCPQEVAALAVMLASPKVRYLSGTVVNMDGGGQWR